ncbi:MAG: fused MFS/spermidine synthase [Armatimonadota bacterium]|nr:MAG: fused MFS/spermidine synthase [Armatimonadota bacterium]
MTIDSGRETVSPRLPVWAVALVHVLFFFSGAAALVYEVVWMRMLSFVFGNTTYAVSVVLAVFLGGLAIGAYVYGRVADRRGDLLRIYGLLEGGAGLIALVLPFVLLGVLTPVYTGVYRWAGESVLALTVARVVLSALVLLGPAILLGGTLPVLIRFLVREERGMESHIGRLYGLNTLGAVAGSFGAGFVLLPFLGLRMSNVVGAGLGFAVAVVALVTHRVLARGAVVLPEPRPGAVPAGGERIGAGVGRWLLAAFAVSGFAALAYEVLWMRLLVFFFESVVYAFSAMLCVYLLGLAVGSLVYSLLLSRSSRQVRWFVILEVLIGLSAAATIPLFLVLQRLHATSLRMSFTGLVEWMFLAAGVIMIVPTVLIGAVFPLVCALWARATRRVASGVGEVYVVNTVGTVAGSLLVGFVVVPAIGTRLAMFAMAGLSLFAGLLVWAAASRARWQVGGRALAAVVIPLALVAVMNRSCPAEEMVRVYAQGLDIEIEWVREGIDGTVTIERMPAAQDALFGRGTDRRLSINAVNVAGTRIDFHTTQKLQAHLGLLIRPEAERVLQVGFGSGGTAYSASLHDVDRVDCVEISRAVIEAAPRFAETNHGVLGDPRVHLYVEDARSFVKHTPHAYDLILSDSTHPILAGEGLLYSVDYLRDCAARLKPGGIFSTWLPVYLMLPADVKVMVRSIREVFPYVYVWHTSVGRNQWCIVHGMKRPLAINYQAFMAAMTAPGVREDLAYIGLERPEELLALLLYDHRAVDRWLADGEQLNTDDNGYLEFLGPRRAFQFPSRRKITFLFTFPDIVLNAGGSILDYVQGKGGPDATWRRAVHRELEANKHVLRGRLYELVNQDAADLTAFAEYRRALAVVPDHFVAKAMLGLTRRQMEATKIAAAEEETAMAARDQLVAASVSLGTLEEAARWAELMAEGPPPEPGPAAVVAVLAQDPEEVARLLGSEPLQSRAHLMGIPRSLFEQAVGKERVVAARPEDARSWRDLGEIYKSMLEAIWANTRVVGGGSASARMRSFRTCAAAALVELSAARYQRALDLAPSDATARFRLAKVRADLGEHRKAIELLEGITQDDVARTGSAVTMARISVLLEEAQATEKNPFGFLPKI